MSGMKVWILWLVVVSCLNHTGNCKMCSNENFLTKVQNGRMLPGYQMLNLSSDGIMQCSRFCLSGKRCKSFNFNTFTEECQLNTESIQDTLTEDSEFIYSDISTWPSRVAGACGGHACPLSSLCDPVDDVLYDCATDHCLGIPIIENGFVESSKSMSPVGTTLEVSCKKGYHPETEIVCHDNGTWSRGGCVALTSCSLVKQLQPESEDGEYWLFLFENMYLSRIYCHEMSSTEPQEFLTLRNLNYGIYPRISNLDCSDEKGLADHCTAEGGEIWYHKIRVDIHLPSSLEVYMTDITFANLSHVKDWLYYGYAVDCYTMHLNSAPRCGVKGKFTIDLRGTGWRISEEQTWSAFGVYPFMHPPQRDWNGTLVHLSCGGYGGGCRPVGGLFLTPYPEGLM